MNAHTSTAARFQTRVDQKPRPKAVGASTFHYTQSSHYRPYANAYDEGMESKFPRQEHTYNAVDTAEAGGTEMNVHVKTGITLLVLIAVSAVVVSILRPRDMPPIGAAVVVVLSGLCIWAFATGSGPTKGRS